MMSGPGHRGDEVRIIRLIRTPLFVTARHSNNFQEIL